MQDGPPNPYIIVGSEDFTASVYKTTNESVGLQYRFSISRLSTRTAFTSEWFHPVDLIALLKLIRVLGSEFISDGCLDTQLHKQLGKVVQSLEQICDETTPKEAAL